MADAPVLVDYKANGIAIVTLNQPKKLNALNQDGYFQLAVALREIAERDDIYITVLTGKGRFFSAYVTREPAFFIYLADMCEVKRRRCFHRRIKHRHRIHPPPLAQKLCSQ